MQLQLSDDLSNGLAWDVTAGDPATVLTLALARLGLEVDATRVRAACERQANPGSLKALVDVAKGLGVTARALRGSVKTLPEIPLPAVVHLQPDGETAGGFALLIDRDDDAVVLEEGNQRDRHLVPIEQFAEVWSGIVVTLAPLAESAVAPSRWLAGLPRSNAAGLWARRAGGVALVALSLAGGIRLGLAGDWWRGLAVIVATALATTAVLISAVLSQHAHAAQGAPTPGGALSRLCGRGGLADCTSVLGSRFGAVLGISLGDVGVGFFTSAVVVGAAAAALPGASASTWYAALALHFVPAVAMAVFCIAVQIHPLRRFCPLCLAVHACGVTAAVALLAAFVWRAPAPLAIGDVLPPMAFAGITFAAVLGTEVLLFALAEATRGAGARLGRIESDALGALAEWRGRPTITLPAPESPFVLGDRAGSVRLDVVLDPACAGCADVADRLARFLPQHPDAFVVVHLPTRASATEHDRALRVALTGLASLECFLAAKDQLMADELPAENDPRALAAHLAPGRTFDIAAASAAQREADLLFARLSTGTPVLLVEGRVFMGGFGELGLALLRYPAAFEPRAA